MFAEISLWIISSQTLIQGVSVQYLLPDSEDRAGGHVAVNLIGRSIACKELDVKIKI
jgi:hypothetical protein